MISKLRTLAAVAVGLSFCTLAGAQAHEHVPVLRAPATRTQQGTALATGNGTASSQATAQIHRNQGSASHRFSSRPAMTPSSFGFDATSGVPGLGFDFPHLAAISAARGNGFSSRGHHGDHRNQTGFFLSILFGGGYPYYADDADADQSEPQPEAPQPQQQVAAVPQPDASQQYVESSAATGSGSAAATAIAPDEAPVPDIGDFILVRRDGRVLFASLFSVVGTQLQYVTPEGIRHTMAVSDIDSNATQQMNEARGSIVQIRN